MMLVRLEIERVRAQFAEARAVPRTVQQQLSDDPDPAARAVLADWAEERGRPSLAASVRSGDGRGAHIRAGAIDHPHEAQICADLDGARGWVIE